MRDYKFRGKRKDNGEWVAGSLTVEYDDSCFIIYWVSELAEPENNFFEMVQKAFEVIPETIGQFTGLKDKNGKEIYEGDILKSFSSSVPSYEVFYYKSSYRLRYKLRSGDFYNWGPLYRMEEILKEGHFKMYPDVIGNIHDNPELVNPALKEGVNIDMNILDPKEGQPEEVKVNAGEQNVPAQDNAIGATDAEEGTTEG